MPARDQFSGARRSERYPELLRLDLRRHPDDYARSRHPASLGPAAELTRRLDRVSRPPVYAGAAAAGLDVVSGAVAGAVVADGDVVCSVVVTGGGVVVVGSTVVVTGGAVSPHSL